MKCKACEMEFSDALTKCPYCGTLSSSLAKQLIINRSSTLFCCPCHVFVNGKNVGTLNTGKSLSTTITVGKCDITLATFSDSGTRILKKRSYSYIVPLSAKGLKLNITQRTPPFMTVYFEVESAHIF